MLEHLRALLRLTLAEPRRAAAILAANTPALHRSGEFAVIVVALGVILSWILAQLLPDPDLPLVQVLLANPLLLAIVQMMLLVLTAIAVFAVGQFFGGRGEFEQAFAITVWLQFFMLVLQVALLPVALIAMPLANLLNSLTYFLFFWLFVNFVAELHGFVSLWRVFAGTLAAGFAISFVFLFLLAILGVGAMEV